MQLYWKKISETDRKIVDFCVQSIEQSGYFLIPVPEIAKRLNVPEEQAGKVLSMLKELEPQGIFDLLILHEIFQLRHGHCKNI